MKNTILILISILVVVCGVLIIFSSGDEYVAEKLFYRAGKTHQKIAANPDVVPPAMLASVENDLKKIIERYPETKTAKTAHITLAEFYLTNKKYAQVFSILDDTIDKYEEDATICSKAQFLKGIAYEKQNLWDKALKEFRILRDKYTDTPLGFQVPLYIANYYKQKGRFAKADEAHQEAVLFYERIERENKGKILGYVAASFLLQSYANLENYEQAGIVLEDIINDYPSTLTYMQQLPKVEAIFIKKLNKSEKAMEIYKNVREKAKNPELIELLEKRIEKLRAQEAEE